MRHARQRNIEEFQGEYLGGGVEFLLIEREAGQQQYCTPVAQRSHITERLCIGCWQGRKQHSNTKFEDILGTDMYLAVSTHVWWRAKKATLFYRGSVYMIMSSNWSGCVVVPPVGPGWDTGASVKVAIRRPRVATES